MPKMTKMKQQKIIRLIFVSIVKNYQIDKSTILSNK